MAAGGCLGPLLPIRVILDVYPLPLLVAAACGLLTALVFAIWPLARAREVSPAAMFRARRGAAGAAAPPAALLALGLGLLALGALAVFGVGHRRLVLIFVAVALCAAALLVGLAFLVLRGVRSIGQRGARPRAHRRLPTCAARAPARTG